MRNWLVLFLLCALALCFRASAGGLTTKDGRAIQSVAVISRLGDDILLFYVEPAMAGARRIAPLPFRIPQFEIDARIERAIASSLEGRVKVVTLPAGIVPATPILDEDDVPGLLAKLPARSDIDAYIVLCHDESAVEMGAIRSTHGLVLYRRWHPFDDITGLFAFYRFMIVDARTGEAIENRTGGIETSIFEPSTARREIDDTYWPGDGVLPSSQQAPALRDKFYEFVDESIAWTLQRSKLVK